MWRWSSIPRDYAAVLAELDRHKGMTTLALRQRLAAKAYARTAVYDAAIANWFARELGEDAPHYRAIGGALVERLRYGENPHQSAAFYRTPETRAGVATARQVQGKQLSYNNINDTDAAYECVAEFDANRTAACVIVKHANPCGVAEGANLAEAYRKALACDPVSAFGGIVAVNRRARRGCARAPSRRFSPRSSLRRKRPRKRSPSLEPRRTCDCSSRAALPDPRAQGLLFKSVAGGFLVQSRDNAVVDDFELKVVTRRAPTNAELRDLALRFASPSMSSRTPLSMPRIVPRSGSAPVR